jgi:hypothetical protein
MQSKRRLVGVRRRGVTGEVEVVWRNWSGLMHVNRGGVNVISGYICHHMHRARETVYRERERRYTESEHRVTCIHVHKCIQRARGRAGGGGGDCRSCHETEGQAGGRQARDTDRYI